MNENCIYVFSLYCLLSMFYDTDRLILSFTSKL